MNGGTKCALCTGFSVVIAIISIVLLALSIQRVEEGQQAVRLDDVSNTLHDRIYQPGLHTVQPDSTFYSWPTKFESINLNIICRSKDGIEINIQTTYQINFIGTELPESFLDLGEKGANLNYLSLHARAALYETCSMFNAVNFTEQRALVEFNMSQAVESIMAPEFGNTHTTMGQFQLTNFEYPEQFQNAVNQKQQTRQQIDVKLQQREQVITEATTNQIRAQQAVTIQINDAVAGRERLLRQANETATTVRAQWDQTILELDAEMTNLGLTFDEFVNYKKQLLIGDVPNAVVSI